MKRAYTRPEILFEGFSLNESIAVGCELKTHTPTNGTCGFEFEGVTVFTASVNGCKPVNGGTIIQDTADNGFCYHVPIASNNIFNS